MQEKDALTDAIKEFRTGASVALGLRQEALAVLQVVAEHLRRIPYTPQAMSLLQEATRVVVVHNDARTATLDVMSQRDEAALGHGIGRLPPFLLELVCEQKLMEWKQVAEAWQQSASARAIAIIELDIPEAHGEDGGGRE